MMNSILKKNNLVSSNSSFILNLLCLSHDALNKYVVHFSDGIFNSYDALYAFYRGEFKEWQELHINFSTDRNIVLSLIYFGEKEWLFAGFYEIIKVENTSDNIINFKSNLLEININLIGKLVFSYPKTQRKKLVNLEYSINHLDLSQILKEKQIVPQFHGFSNTIVDYELLKSIVNNENSTWQKALGNARGIYLITDTKTGRLYVGSVYGETSFWGYWQLFATNGHGGNRPLHRMLLIHGKSYASNFQFSFLEILDSFVTNDKISERELFWKNALKTREFGYNIT